jgi:hypothetical protein
MSDFDSRKRMISLRISEAEYKALKSCYRTYGARNVSDLTRLALQQIMEQAPNTADLSETLAALDERLRRLESHVSLLLERENVTA